MRCRICGGTDFKENEKSWRCNFCRNRFPKKSPFKENGESQSLEETTNGI